MHLLQIPKFYHKKCEAHKDKDGRVLRLSKSKSPGFTGALKRFLFYDSEIFSRIERHAVASHFVMKM